MVHSFSWHASIFMYIWNAPKLPGKIQCIQNTNASMTLYFQTIHLCTLKNFPFFLYNSRKSSAVQYKLDILLVPFTINVFLPLFFYYNPFLMNGYLKRCTYVHICILVWNVVFCITLNIRKCEMLFRYYAIANSINEWSCETPYSCSPKKEE